MFSPLPCRRGAVARVRPGPCVREAPDTVAVPCVWLVAVAAMYTCIECIIAAHCVEEEKHAFLRLISEALIA